MNPTTEKEQVGKFVLWAASLGDGRGTLCSPEHVECIKAAAERITRQIERNRSNARNAGRKPVKKPSKKTLAQRKWRARLKEAK